MSKFIHVDGDDGRIKVSDEQLEWGIGWVYKVPDDFQFNLTLGDAENHLYIYELLNNDERAELVHQF